MSGETVGRRQSAVEVAGGYVLDYIRSRREERDSIDRVAALAAELDEARSAQDEAVVARTTASARLDGYIQAAVAAE